MISQHNSFPRPTLHSGVDHRRQAIGYGGFASWRRIH